MWGVHFHTDRGRYLCAEEERTLYLVLNPQPLVGLQNVGDALCCLDWHGALLHHDFGFVRHLGYHSGGCFHILQIGRSTLHNSYSTLLYLLLSKCLCLVLSYNKLSNHKNKCYCQTNIYTSINISLFSSFYCNYNVHSLLMFPLYRLWSIQESEMALKITLNIPVNLIFWSKLSFTFMIRIKSHSL